MKKIILAAALLFSLSVFGEDSLTVAPNVYRGSDLTINANGLGNALRIFNRADKIELTEISPNLIFDFHPMLQGVMRMSNILDRMSGFTPPDLRSAIVKYKLTLDGAVYSGTCDAGQATGSWNGEKGGKIFTKYDVSDCEFDDAKGKDVTDKVQALLIKRGGKSNIVIDGDDFNKELLAKEEAWMRDAKPGLYLQVSNDSNASAKGDVLVVE